MSKTTSLLSALLCTFIWGTTFIAQDTGMDNIGPFTFNAVRFFIGFLAITPLVFLFISFLIFCFSNNNANGIIERKPIKNLVPLKVRGPILSIPVSCAIKVVPQIKVHNRALNKDIGFVI